MDDIVTSVQLVADIIGSTAAASAEQSAGIEQVNQAVVQMDEMTQQNAAMVEEVAAAAESLQEQAARLAVAVGVFRLDAGACRSQVEPPALGNRVAAMPKFASPAAPARAIAAPKKLAAGGGNEEWEEF